jgi:sterol desaturase/sphingolipid hydroxylase (fatty acid hydroxylase superfamily)
LALIDDLRRAAAILQPAALELLWCALAFAALALFARGIASLRTALAAASEVCTNLALFAIDLVFVTPALGFTLAALGAWMQANGIALIHPVAWSGWPSWSVALLAIFAGDFIGYLRHRLEHTPPLWPAHAIHHSDTAMTWTTGLRFHPINRFSTALIDTTLLALLGFPPWALVANNLARHYYGLFIHMDLPWTYGPLGRVLVSPAMHRWHHVRGGQGVGANFATVFSVFDQAFATHYAPGPCTALLGVPEKIGRGALAQLWWPFRVGMRSFAKEPSPLEGRGCREATGEGNALLPTITESPSSGPSGHLLPSRGEG